MSISKFFGKLCLSMIACLTMEFSPALAGTQLHGNDPLVTLINQGRDRALAAIRDIHLDLWENYGIAGKWFKENRLEFFKDLQNSEIKVWADASPIGTCAATAASRGTTINFYQPQCLGKLSTVEDVAAVLIHEVTHHFGYRDEVFPDRVAGLVRLQFNGSDRRSRNGTLHLALAYSPRENFTNTSWDGGELAATQTTAMQGCPYPDCRLAIWVTNGCVALSNVPTDPSVYATAWAETRFAAKLLAYELCGRSDCAIAASVCTTTAKSYE